MSLQYSPMSLTVSKGQFSSVSSQPRAGVICPAKSPALAPAGPSPAWYLRHCPLLEEVWSVKYEFPHKSLLFSHVLLPDLELCCPSLSVSRQSGGGGTQSPSPALLVMLGFEIALMKDRMWHWSVDSLGMRRSKRTARWSVGVNVCCFNGALIWLYGEGSKPWKAIPWEERFLLFSAFVQMTEGISWQDCEPHPWLLMAELQNNLKYFCSWWPGPVLPWLCVLVWAKP